MAEKENKYDDNVDGKYYCDIECIDCNLCVPSCPVEAIYPEDEVTEKFESYIELNATLAKEWPVIDQKKDPPEDHDKFKNEKDKFEKYFNENF